jgi:hypothetical protein
MHRDIQLEQLDRRLHARRHRAQHRRVRLLNGAQVAVFRVGGAEQRVRHR